MRFCLHIYYKHTVLCKYMAFCLNTQCSVFSKVCDESLLTSLKSCYGGMHQKKSLMPKSVNVNALSIFPLRQIGDKEKQELKWGTKFELYLQ